MDANTNPTQPCESCDGQGIIGSYACPDCHPRQPTQPCGIDTTDCEECGTIGISVGANCPRCGTMIGPAAREAIEQ
jgi:hypothetical protein